MSKPKVQWLGRDAAHPLPYYTLVTSNEQYQAVVKHLGTKNPPAYQSDGIKAYVHIFTREGKTTCVVVFDANATKHYDSAAICGVLIHEAVHIAQEYFASFGETAPASEQQAYAIQAISEELIRSFSEQVYPKKRSKP